MKCPPEGSLCYGTARQKRARLTAKVIFKPLVISLAVTCYWLKQVLCLVYPHVDIRKHEKSGPLKKSSTRTNRVKELQMHTPLAKFFYLIL